MKRKRGGLRKRRKRKDEKDEKEGKEGGGRGGAAHSIDSRAISAIVRERESRLGRGKASLIVGEHNTAFLIPNIYPS